GDEAGLGLLAIGAAAEDVAGELEVVGGRVEAAQAEAKAGLAAGRAVAGAGVAAADVEGGDQFVTEADRQGLVEVLDDEGYAGGLRARLDDQRGRARLHRHQEAAGADHGYVGSLQAEVAKRRQVTHGAVGVAAGDDELLQGPWPGQG